MFMMTREAARLSMLQRIIDDKGLLTLQELVKHFGSTTVTINGGTTQKHFLYDNPRFGPAL